MPRLLAPTLVAVLVGAALLTGAPAGAAPGVTSPSGEEAASESVAMYVVATDTGLEEGGALSFTFTVRGDAPGSLGGPLRQDAVASTGSCTGTAPPSSSCSAAFSNTPGSTRLFNVMSSVFVGTFTATVHRTTNGEPVASLTCSGPALSLAPGGLSCTGPKSFTSDETTLLLRVSTSGTGLFWVEVR
ncbi:MAG TPA: hypothetical protein VNZ52_06500 [Candidatus Thermoplasmatota archaeon]|nr:hypothetical protein [Candidatus Thermoplasmatota archaeon]